MEIPEPVAMEILSKLPVKSLTRFRCVCKPWSASFRTSYFITKHYHNNLNNNTLNLLLKLGNTGNVYTYFSALLTEKGLNFEVRENIHLPLFEKCLRHPKVFGPCNGLYCFSEYGGQIMLWNPSTREFKIIPKFIVPNPPPSGENISLGCLGFGFDSTNDDYKVVRFVDTYLYLHVIIPHLPPDWYSIRRVKLYSLKSNSWKEISAPKTHLRGFNSFNRYLNGFYYWEAIESCGRPVIISFDMVNEKFSTLPFPTIDHNLSVNLLDFNGLLGAIATATRWKGTIWKKTMCLLDVWVMNGSWTRLCKIEFDCVPSFLRPLGVWKDSVIFLKGVIRNELVFFNPATKEVNDLGIGSCPDDMQLIVYAESLVPINERSEQEEHITRQPA